MSSDIECIDIILYELNNMVMKLYNIAHFKSKCNDNYKEIEANIYKYFFNKVDSIILTDKSARILRIFNNIQTKLIELDIKYPEVVDEDIKALKVLKYILEHTPVLKA